MVEFFFVLGVTLLTAAATFGIMALSLALRGFVLSKLWGWFIVPIFGLHPIGIAAAIGLTFVANYLIQGPSDYAKETDKDQVRKSTFVSFSTPFMALLFGYVVHLFL